MFKVWAPEANDTRAVREALEVLRPKDPPDTWGPAHEEAVRTLRTRRWNIFQYKHELPPPEPIEPGEHTLRDLHAVCMDVLVSQGARMVVELFAKYGITRLGDLPANRFNAFYADARMAFDTLTSEETRLGA